MRRKFVRIKSIQYVIAISTIWAIADGLVSFYLPIQMQEYLHNIIVFGIIFGASSGVGALADIVLGVESTLFKYTTYLLLGLIGTVLLAVCAVLLPFNLITILLLIALWGGYYEFIQIGIFNYVSRHKDSDEYATSFGRIYVFEYMSYVIAPIIAGILVIQGKVPIYVLAIACVVTAMLFILPLQKLHQRREKPLLTYETKVNFNIKKEIESLKKVWQIAFVMLIAVFMYNIWLSFVWTLIPIQSTISNPIIAGLITATFTIPLATLQGIGEKPQICMGKTSPSLPVFL